MIKFKDGVKAYCKTGTVRRETWYAIEEAEKVYKQFGKDCIVTSLCDGKHSRHSRHYFGNAVDFRTRHLTDEEKLQVVDLLAKILGNDYDCILEKTHLHCEHDPK
jgi:hypothetical protein